MRQFDYSKLTKISYDSEIISYISKINQYKGKQELYIRQKPIELERLIEIARIQSTESSNSIEGIRTTSTRMKQLLSEKTAPKSRDEEEIIGYRDVLDLIHSSHEEIKIVPNHILQLHKILLSHTNLSYGGNFKSVQNYITETYPNGEAVTRFTPLSPFETPAAISSICESYNRTKELELIDDDENTGINFLEKYNLEPAEVESASNIVSNTSNKEVKAFKVSQVISPIYGVKKEVINNNDKEA